MKSRPLFTKSYNSVIKNLSELAEANSRGILPEAATAKHHVVLANKTVVVSALSANVPKSTLAVILWVSVERVRHDLANRLDAREEEEGKKMREKEKIVKVRNGLQSKVGDGGRAPRGEEERKGREEFFQNFDH